MYIISWGDNLHETSKSYFLRKNNLLSFDSAQRVVKVNDELKLEMCQFDTDAPAQGPSYPENKHFAKKWN